MQSGSTPEPPYYYLYTQFDLSSIPSSATINSAILYYYIWDATVGIPTSQIYIHPNMGVWNEATITWTSKPPAGANCGTCLNSPTPGQWMTIDVKDGVQKWVSGTLTNYGLRVHAWGGGYFKTYTKENAANQPYLVVDYSGGSQPGPFSLISPTNGASLPPGTVNFSWTASSGMTSYTLELDGNPYTGITTTSYSLSVTTTGLHNWHVTAINAYGQTLSTPANSTFTIVNNPPPGSFNLIYPANGASIPAGSITFDWADSSNATSYTLTLDGTPQSDVTISQQTINVTTLGAHTWGVVAHNAYGNTPSTPSSSNFTVISNQPPGAFNLISPTNGENLSPGDITFDWADSTNATSYTLTLDGTPQPNVTVSQQTINITTLGAHTWGVVAHNAYGNTPSTPTSSGFNIVNNSAPGSFSLLQPPNNGAVSPGWVNFSWQVASGATSYQILVDNNSNFSSPEFQQTVTGTTASFNITTVGTTYYWRVTAYNSYGNRQCNADFHFIVQNGPGPFSLLLPASGSTLSPGNITFTWQPSSNATLYDFYLSTSSSFGNPTAPNLTATYFTYNVSTPHIYYWKVIAKNNLGVTRECNSVFTFTISDLVPTIKRIYINSLPVKETYLNDPTPVSSADKFYLGAIFESQVGHVPVSCVAHFFVNNIWIGQVPLVQWEWKRSVDYDETYVTNPTAFKSCQWSASSPFPLQPSLDNVTVRVELKVGEALLTSSTRTFSIGYIHKGNDAYDLQTDSFWQFPNHRHYGNDIVSNDAFWDSVDNYEYYLTNYLRSHDKGDEFIKQIIGQADWCYQNILLGSRDWGEGQCYGMTSTTWQYYYYPNEKPEMLLSYITGDMTLDMPNNEWLVEADIFTNQPYQQNSNLWANIYFLNWWSGRILPLQYGEYDYLKNHINNNECANCTLTKYDNMYVKHSVLGYKYIFSGDERIAYVYDPNGDKTYFENFGYSAGNNNILYYMNDYLYSRLNRDNPSYITYFKEENDDYRTKFPFGGRSIISPSGQVFDNLMTANPQFECEGHGFYIGMPSYNIELMSALIELLDNGNYIFQYSENNITPNKSYKLKKVETKQIKKTKETSLKNIPRNQISGEENGDSSQIMVSINGEGTCYLKDSANRRTGIINGQVIEEMPNSDVQYYPDEAKMMHFVCSPEGSMELVCQGNGSDKAKVLILRPIPGNRGVLTYFKDLPVNEGTTYTANFLMNSPTIEFVRDNGNKYQPLYSVIYGNDLGEGKKASLKNSYFYPNPYNPKAQIGVLKFSPASDCHATIKIFNANGKTVKKLGSDIMISGNTTTELLWDGRNDSGMDVANGVYFYSITTNTGEKAYGKIAIIR